MTQWLCFYQHYVTAIVLKESKQVLYTRKVMLKLVTFERT